MNLFKKKYSSDNLFTSFLSEFGLPYTQNYSNKLYNEHPYKI